MKKQGHYILTTLGIGLLMLLATVANAQPVRAQNDLYGVLSGSCSYYLDVAANDEFDSTNVYTLAIISTPAAGIANVNGNYLSYCAPAGFTGTDQFMYRVIAGGVADSATVYINVLPANNYIFPGDADQNSVVENYDVLAIGLAYNLTGPSRLDSNAVNALAWPPTSYLNTDPGAADCDGNGLVSNIDVTEVVNHFGQTYPFISYYEVDTSRCSGAGYPFYIESLSSDSLMDGDTVELAIKLGDGFTAADVYGAAFTLNYDKSFVAGNQAQIFDSNSWLAQSDSLLLFHKEFQVAGKIDLAVSKTNHIEANGGGELLRARIPIDDNIDGIISAPGWHDLNFSLSKPRVIGAYNIVKDVCVQQYTVHVYKMAAGLVQEEAMQVSMYPNPAKNAVTILGDDLRGIMLTDITGRRVYKREFQSTNQLQLNINSLGLQSGTYLVQLTDGSGAMVIKKLIVQP